MGSEKSAIVIAFKTAADADRRVAGVAAAARIARDVSLEGRRPVILAVPGAALRQITLDDIGRVNPSSRIEIADSAAGWPGARPAPRLSALELLRRTAKSSDGLVSRWLNRPISRLISAALLTVPGFRPVHATIGTAALSMAMFAALVLGGPAGLIAGGLLFHAASVFDGVDGEVARATFRTSRLGAVLDSVIDMTTNIAFIVGVTVNLAPRQPWAAEIGVWSLSLLILGLGAIGAAAARQDKPFTMDLVKERQRERQDAPVLAKLMRGLTIATSRDFFAFVFALLILAGIPMVGLCLFAASVTVWIWFVLGAVAATMRRPSMERSA
jgi:phosphatidylglycerophosphate synthase